MAIVLGIDTGGTYTDGIVIDVDSKQILAETKANTTHRDLVVGIRNCVGQLDYEGLDRIDYVALSTTLATNAIVRPRFPGGPFAFGHGTGKVPAGMRLCGSARRLQSGAISWRSWI